LVAKDDLDTYLTKDAGSPIAAKRSIQFINSLPDRPTVFSPNKSFKELYDKTQTL
jgi:hypothetical protein